MIILRIRDEVVEAREMIDGKHVKCFVPEGEYTAEEAWAPGIAEQTPGTSADGWVLTNTENERRFIVLQENLYITGFEFC